MAARKYLLLILLIVISINAFAQKTVSVTSPDSKIKFSLSTDKEGLFYKVTYKGVLLVDKSRLKISFKEGGAFNNNLSIASAKPEHLIEDYTLLAGRSGNVHSECNRVIVPVKET